MAVAVSVPAGILLWPSSDEPLTLEPVAGLGQIQREAPLSRGSAERTTPPELASPTIGTPTPTKTPKPTPTPTKKPKPEPTKAPTPTKTPEPAPEPEPDPTAVGEMYVTTGLNVRTEPSADGDVVTVLERGVEVQITGETDDQWVEIIYDGEATWVSGDYLSEDEPPPEETEEPDDGISYEECESGSEVEQGLTPDAIRVHRAVCDEFPDVDSYGGLRSGDGGEHGTGQALDVMVSSSSLGDAIAAWVREHYAELGVSEVIWAQRIWTVERSSEGWRWMEDRGSSTANHYDHVHVTVYGDSGG